MEYFLAILAMALYVAVIVFFVMLAWRLVRAVERVAGALERVADSPGREIERRPPE
jgi:uncharacterized membrane protein